MSKPRHLGVRVRRHWTLKERLEFYSMPEPNSGCVLWCAGSMYDGYAHMTHGYRTERAHRLSWIAHRGPIPDGMHVCHKCDVRSCINPDHLFLGTHLDNMRDMYAKNRRRLPKGGSHPHSKVTDAQRAEIAASSASRSKLAAQYNISPSLVGKIKKEGRA